ncbi:diaminopimelate epimerase [Ferruginibacter yonginensis]|uniref:Diaminopimelate epimerase n=1 Tax=Ferruginibacter yonginensis TaxID=1310416 RepID=A0ABV8QP99_9BACT
MQFDFLKYQGTGNDFIIADNRKQLYNELSTETVRHLCDRKFGIGADGLILLNNSITHDFEMQYFNADGNIGSMCGNGGRCIVQFAHDNGIVKDSYVFEAADGLHEANITQQKIVQLKMNPVNAVQYFNDYSVLNTGSPHYVSYGVGVKNKDVFAEGKAIRYNETFSKEGINVNFVEVMGANNIFVRTYERGVENETASCGTGVTAAALMYPQNSIGANNIQINTIGGNLNVTFNKINDQQFDNIYLCGPASFVFKGSIQI